MLLVDAHVGVSEIHGLGLISGQIISAGTTIWQFQPGFDVAVTEAEYGNLPPNARRAIDYYSYHCKIAGMHVLSSDDDRFTNHSADPNSIFVDGVTIAVRDIQPGEEVTMNYNEFGVLPALPRALWPRVEGQVHPQAPTASL